ncbi:MAG: DUF2946 family protein [Burkholderiales bacterium]|jgi:hypothetical protein|nr:MAG: DUF2946 family protein [Burkholderiales bacterium]
MDDIVKAALKKWPNVPDCYGWLALDARGDWYMRDEPTQAAGPFPQVKGSRITHVKLQEFIHRNYEHDDRGAWFFQNGPQRVYLQLEAAPMVMGVRKERDGPQARFTVETHTGLPVQEVKACWLDDQGRLFLDTDRGFGVVRSLDMDAAADAVEAGVWTPQEMAFAEMPARFGYCLDPRPQAKTGT